MWLSKLATEHDAHMSKNIFKVIDDTNFVQMMTIRWYTGIYVDFDAVVDKFISRLSESGFVLEKKIVEFSVFDTKVNHDSVWLKT